MRRTILSLLATVFLGAAAQAADVSAQAPMVADGTPIGTITLKGETVAAGVGFAWGNGQLEYLGKVHQISVKGFSVVDVGAAHFTARGHVYDLKRLEDFPGNYIAVAAGVALAGGSTATYLRNEHGVVIRLIEEDLGLRLDLSADGVRIALKQ
ncbi:EipA family protein [Povalibacter sp.]|uniref:EipA family protein n=1 Tax=Povalibacter sp. TaxID=1962978 RepID=UPI002F4101BF